MKSKLLSKRSLVYICVGLGAGLVLAFSFVTYRSIAPASFPQREIVTIEPGTYLSQAADLLESEGIIRSPFLFKAFTVLVSGHRQVLSGSYLFDRPQSALKVAFRMANGIEGLPKIKVTIVEGATTKDISLALKKSISGFDSAAFLLLAKQYEGYLFPDTYYFYENTKPEAVISMLRNTFDQRTKAALPSIQAFGKPLSDVIAMASIVEKEATSTADRKIIAGILWKRVDMGMPLQVDPPFYYILGKDSSELTLKDLASDSPYNLYTHKGLPPAPIDNPGLDAILDTVTPTGTKYLFYLSDKKGNMHYAATHEGHLANKDKYIQ